MQKILEFGVEGIKNRILMAGADSLIILVNRGNYIDTVLQIADLLLIGEFGMPQKGVCVAFKSRPQTPGRRI
jgi:hypothetical protein